MPETDKTETVEQPEVQATEEAEKFDEARAKELIAKLRAVEKQGKADARKLADYEAKEQAHLEEEKSELQKAQDRADQAERKARAAELAVMRRDIAEKVNLPKALADRIKGETPEEMEADALTILAAMPAKVPPALNPTNPGAPQTGETEAEKRKRLIG
jgi:hypothetical protein